jgi:hypothetical protein
MEHNDANPKSHAHPAHLEALAFCMTVDIIRKAKGKKNPGDFPVGSVERTLAEDDLIRDTLLMLGIDPDDNLASARSD